jgi:hypothetical protein
VTSRRILGNHESQGSIPYYNGSPSFATTGPGTPGYGLVLDSTGKIPGWRSIEGAKLVSATSGTADTVITNLPEDYNDIVVRMWGTSTGPLLDTFTYTGGNTLGSTIYNAYYGIDQDSTFSTTTITAASNNLAQIPYAAAWTANATYGAVFEVHILDYANKSGLNTTDRPIFGVTYNAPGSSAIQGFRIHNGRIALPNGTDKITGFTVNVGNATQAYVYLTR